MNTFLDVQDQVAAELANIEELAAVEVISERRKEIQDRLDKAVAKFDGLFITVLLMRGKNHKPGLLGPRLAVTIDIGITEKVKLNREPGGTGIYATQALELILARLQGFKPASALQMLDLEDFGPMASPENLDPSLLQLSASFKTIIHLTTTANLTETP